MKDTEIIEALRSKLRVPGGRHLYGVLGTYRALEAFALKLRDARTPDGKRFPKPVNINSGILETIPDDEFRRLVVPADIQVRFLRGQTLRWQPYGSLLHSSQFVA